MLAAMPRRASSPSRRSPTGPTSTTLRTASSASAARAATCPPIDVPTSVTEPRAATESANRRTSPV